MQSIKDFFSLFLSNIIQKLFGLIREPIIAYFFGSSLVYSSYLLLRTGADLLSQFTQGESIRAGLLPKLTKIYNKYDLVSLQGVRSFSKKIMLFLFVISQVLQAAIILYLDTDYTEVLFCLSFLLSIILCYNFFNTIFLTIIQAQGDFFRFSVVSILNPLIGVLFIYPLTILWSIIGLVLSRLMGILSLTFAYILPMISSSSGYKIELKKEDFNIPILFIGNFANIIIICTRFISGIDGSNNIAYFTYSVFILNALLTAIINNINTLLLKTLSVKKNFRIILYTVAAVLFLGFLLIILINLFGDEIITLVFQRGAFTQLDSILTAGYLKLITIPFILISIASILFQPFFASNYSCLKRDANFIVYLFIVVCIFSSMFIGFSNYTTQENSLIMLYSLSLTSLLLAIFACYRSIRNES